TDGAICRLLGGSARIPHFCLNHSWKTSEQSIRSPKTPHTKGSFFTNRSVFIKVIHFLHLKSCLTDTKLIGFNYVLYTTNLISFLKHDFDAMRMILTIGQYAFDMPAS